MQHKTFPIDVKAADDDSGTFEALVSVFGNVDLVGDRVMPGAFSKTLERWRETGDPLPIVLSHRWDDVMSHIGVADPKDVVETDDGLLVKGRLDLADNEVARQVYKLLKRRSLKEFSFGYTVNEERVAKDGANELLDVDLVEAGPTLKGANPLTELRAVKSALGLDQNRTTTTDEEPPAKSLDDVRRRIQRSRIAIR
jgi:HK97 family phage prohead protease